MADQIETYQNHEEKKLDNVTARNQSFIADWKKEMTTLKTAVSETVRTSQQSWAGLKIALSNVIG